MSESVVYQAERVVVDCKDLVILDTGATISIFVNKNLLYDIKETNPIYIRGITQEKIISNTKGKCAYLMDLEVYIVESLHINIVCFADLDRIKFIERCKKGFIFDNTITFVEVEKLYICGH